MIRLETERFIIRDPLLTDLDGWHRLLSDPVAMYYLNDIMTRTIEESCKNLEAAVSDAENPNRIKYFFAIEEKLSGAFIGTIGYTVTKTTPIGKFVGAGYFILPEYQGKGCMTEVFQEVIRFAFEDNGVFKISSGCISENRASERVMQKCGMIKEAEYKSHTWHDGRIKDRMEYRLINDEWKTIRNTENSDFWKALETLVAKSEIIIDRPKGSNHPKYTEFTYPLNYGYLKGTTAMDGGGIDVWRGSVSGSGKKSGARKGGFFEGKTTEGAELDAIMCIVDLMKRDSEIKLLIGCTEEEKALVCKMHNETEFMKGIMIRRR